MFGVFHVSRDFCGKKRNRENIQFHYKIVDVKKEKSQHVKCSCISPLLRDFLSLCVIMNHLVHSAQNWLDEAHFYYKEILLWCSFWCNKCTHRYASILWFDTKCLSEENLSLTSRPCHDWALDKQADWVSPGTTDMQPCAHNSIWSQLITFSMRSAWRRGGRRGSGLRQMQEKYSASATARPIQ